MLVWFNITSSIIERRKCSAMYRKKKINEGPSTCISSLIARCNLSYKVVTINNQITQIENRKQALSPLYT